MGRASDYLKLPGLIPRGSTLSTQSVAIELTKSQ